MKLDRRSHPAELAGLEVDWLGWSLSWHSGSRPLAVTLRALGGLRNDEIARAS
jgi:hypothetical protein